MNIRLINIAIFIMALASVCKASDNQNAQQPALHNLSPKKKYTPSRRQLYNLNSLVGCKG